MSWRFWVRCDFSISQDLHVCDSVTEVQVAVMTDVTAMITGPLVGIDSSTSLKSSLNSAASTSSHQSFSQGERVSASACCMLLQLRF